MQNIEISTEHTHYLEVLRDRTRDKGIGLIRLIRSSEDLYRVDSLPTTLYEAPCITGGSKLDPRSYGGLTPPIQWEIAEPIQSRRLSQANRSLVMARMKPCDLAAARHDYPNRTFERMELDPYMLHWAGISSGCVAIPSPYWSSFPPLFNEALKANGGIIKLGVYEREDLHQEEAHYLEEFIALHANAYP